MMIRLDENLEIDAVRVTNALGQEIAQLPIMNGQAHVDLSQAGMYFVSLIQDGNVIATKRILKQ